MNEHLSSPQISRRSLLRGGAAAAAVAVVGLPLASCTTGPDDTSATGSTATTPPSTTTPPPTGQHSGAGVANIHVSRDHYGIHIEPAVAANPRHPRQLLAACQAAPQLQNPQLIATYLSVDAGATWQNGALPQPPAGQAPASDDVTVAFDPQGRGYLCASRAANTPGGRAMYVWRTDDGGRSFSAPLALVPEGVQELDHQAIAAGAGQTPQERNVYVTWAGGADNLHPNDLGFTRSTDGGHSFEPPRTILTDHRPSVMTAGPRLAAGPRGLVCAGCPEATHFTGKLPPPPSGGSHHKPPPGSEGDLVAQMVAVCSTDGGQSFAAPVRLGWGTPIISLPGGVTANGSDPAVAAAPHGDALYAAYTTHHPGATHSDIVVTASHDRGRTWTKPVTATPHDDVIYFQPNLAVDEAGRVGISAFALAHGHVNQVLLLSKPHQLHFQAPLQVTTNPFDPHTGTLSDTKHGAWWIGDYQGITASAGAFHLMWNDTRTGKLDLFAATVRP
jgi:TAT (twin-arginine translocation) pathway signal sequence